MSFCKIGTCKMFCFQILLGFLCVLYGALESRSIRCQSTPANTHGCCDGYVWDAVKKDCVECISGYTGIGCTLTCLYPLYGKDCQQICDCSRMECNFEFGCRSDEEKGVTVPHVTLTSFSKYVNQSHGFESRSTSAVVDINETQDEDSLKNSIKTIWQLMLMILAVLVFLALVYLGKCVRRHFTSRTHQVSHVNTVTPNVMLNENHQIEDWYEQIQDAEHEDSGRYLKPACNESEKIGPRPNQETIEEKIELVSISMMPGPSNDNVQKREKASDKNDIYENTVKEYDDIYISPCEIEQ